MKKWLSMSILALLTGMVVFFGSPGTAEAALFARPIWTGYFNNQFDDDGLDLYAGGITVTDINSFVDFYDTRVNSGSAATNIPAAFTILNMLGAPAGTAWTQARTRFAEWESAVRWYAANGRINFNVDYSFTTNTYLQDSVVIQSKAAPDVAWYSESGTVTLPSIVFYNPDGTTYAIKRDCANRSGRWGDYLCQPVWRVGH
jgi:hypothetical protein